MMNSITAWRGYSHAGEKIQEEALSILMVTNGNNHSNLTGKELSTLMLFYDVEKKDQGKNYCKKLKEKNAYTNKFIKWTEADEARHTKLMSHDYPLEDTEFGRQKAELKMQKKKELVRFAKENPEEVAEIVRAPFAFLLMSSKSKSKSNEETVIPPKSWL